MATEAELLEIKKIGEDVNAGLVQLKGQLQEKANTADTNAQLEGMKAQYRELEEKFKKQGDDLSALSTKMNRGSLAGLFGGDSPYNEKDLENQLVHELTEAEKKGSFAPENAHGRKVIQLKDGHKAIQQKAVGTITTGNLTDGTNPAYATRTTLMRPIMLPEADTRVRSLLPSSPMTTALLEYPQDKGGEGDVGYQVNQGDVKSQLDFDVQMMPVTAKIIAGITKVSKKALNDIPWLASFINNRLSNKLLNFEDNALLNGTGVNSIKGIIPSSTAYVRTKATYTTIFEYLLDAAAQLRTKYFRPNGILLHPLDYVELLRYKTSTGEFDYPGLIFGGPNRDILYFMGLPIFQNAAVPRLTGIVADWNSFELLYRQGITFDISYEDADNFQRNLVTLRLEEEIALAVYQPEGSMALNLAQILS